MYRVTLRMSIILRSSSPGAGHFKGSSADYHFIQLFSYQLNGQSQYFHIVFLLTHIAKYFLLRGITSLPNHSEKHFLHCAIHVTRTTRLDAETGKFCRTTVMEFNKYLKSYQRKTTFLVRQENTFRGFSTLPL